MLLISYFCAVLGFSSTSSLKTLTLSALCSAKASRAGAMCRHGPHQVAQKSTTTSPLPFSTFSSKVASSTAWGLFSAIISLPFSYYLPLEVKIRERPYKVLFSMLLKVMFIIIHGGRKRNLISPAAPAFPADIDKPEVAV